MIEIELLCKIVESKIREEHEDCLNTVNRLLRRNRIQRKDKYMQGFSKGVKTALHILVREYKAFDKRLKKEEKAGKKF